MLDWLLLSASLALSTLASMFFDGILFTTDDPAREVVTTDEDLAAEINEEDRAPDQDQKGEREADGILQDQESEAEVGAETENIRHRGVILERECEQEVETSLCQMEDLLELAPGLNSHSSPLAVCPEYCIYRTRVNYSWSTKSSQR